MKSTELALMIGAGLGIYYLMRDKNSPSPQIINEPADVAPQTKQILTDKGSITVAATTGYSSNVQKFLDQGLTLEQAIKAVAEQQRAYFETQRNRVDRILMTGEVTRANVASLNPIDFQYAVKRVRELALAGIVVKVPPNSSLDGVIRSALEPKPPKPVNEVKSAYEQLEDKAKMEGALLLNKELGTDLKGTESFDEIMTVVSGALGGKAASAGCSTVGIPGPMCAQLGAVAGAYLGDKAAPYLRKAYSEVKDFIGSTVKDAIVGGIKDAWNKVF